MPEDSAFETMKLEYIALRQEILQSISYQHQILLAGYGATGVFAGYVVVKPFPASYLAALIIIPFILLGMASLWIVECNRMVRASYYIGRILWPCLRDECTSKPRNQHLQEVGWECWIRSKNKKDEASRFRERQHRSQCIVVFWAPVFLSTVTSIVAVLDAFWIPQKLTVPQRVLPWVLLCLALFAAGLWMRMHSDVTAISDLGETQILATAVGDDSSGSKGSRPDAHFQPDKRTPSR